MILYPSSKLEAKMRLVMVHGYKIFFVVNYVDTVPVAVW